MQGDSLEESTTVGLVTLGDAEVKVQVTTGITHAIDQVLEDNTLTDQKATHSVKLITHFEIASPELQPGGAFSSLE